MSAASSSSYAELEAEAARVLAGNDRGSHIAPSLPTYPEQWLWDSAYAAIGLARIDPPRAVREIESVLAGQRVDGMVPHMILRAELRSLPLRSRLAWRLWATRLASAAADAPITSSITQPPVIAEAVWRVGLALDRSARRDFWAWAVPRLARYHQWLYRDRDLGGDGLVASLHPWETGMDNSPPWIDCLRAALPASVRGFVRLALSGRVVRGLRLSAGELNGAERIRSLDGVINAALLIRLRRRQFASLRNRPRSAPCIEDVGFNSLFTRNNAVLCELAKDCGHTLDEGLLENMARTAAALNLLWDDRVGLHFSREVWSRRLLAIPTSASLLALYSGALDRNQIDRVVRHLESGGDFATPHPVPSVPPSDPHFDEVRFWSGPTWINVNWHLIDGLARAGQIAARDALLGSTLGTVAQAGFYEYFSPIDGRGLGAPNFSWTAALILDLLAQRAR